MGILTLPLGEMPGGGGGDLVTITQCVSQKVQEMVVFLASDE